jgi:hypothetical protein
VAAAASAFNSLLAAAPATKRPLETWQLVIQPATRPGDRYDYFRAGSGDLAWLTDDLNDRVFLDQGLGLQLGSIFTVEGFADVSAGVPAGYAGMELLRILAVVTPLAGDNDGNGNLLDDEWELFFFGAVGALVPSTPIRSAATATCNTMSAVPTRAPATSPIRCST